LEKPYIYWAVIIFWTALLPSKLFSEGIADNFGFGISGEYNLENHNIENSSLYEIKYLIPGKFSGSGNNTKIGLELNYRPDNTKYFTFSAGYGFRKLNLDLAQNETINLDSTAILGTFNHNFRFNSESIFLKIEFQYEFISTVGIGGNFSYNLNIGNDFQYKQVLIYPIDRGYFIDTGTRTRNGQTGKLENFSSGNFAGGIYIYREFPLDLDFKVVAVPKLGFSQSLIYTDKSSGWMYNSVFLSVSVLIK
jgi:hypothetical protein